MLAVSAAGLFLSVTLLAGFIILERVPERLRPTVSTPWPALKWLAIAIAVLSYAPVWNIISIFSEDLGFWMTFNSVMFTFQEGTAYWVTLGICISLFIALLGVRKLSGPRGGLVTFLLASLVFVQGWGSHVSSLVPWGSLAQSLHLTSVYVWVGPLLCIAWFSKSQERWREFLQWFTPLSIGSVLLLTISGLLLMGVTVPEYRNSWMMTYGQALLVKHLLFVPVIVFAMCNGFLYKYSVRQSSFNAVPWLRVESILLVLIFAMSGTLSISTPPHDVSLTLNEAVVSPLFLMFLEDAFNQDLNVLMDLNGLQYSLVALSFLALAGIVLLFFRKKRGARWAFGFAISAVLCSYFAIMTSVRLG